MIGSWDWGALVDTVEGAQVNVFSDDPLFVDAANDDYRLAAGSLCIDAGDNSYVMCDRDLAGNARIANGTVDIGCYESGSVPAGGSLSDGLVAYYPFDGNANDASGNGNHGTVYGVTPTTDRLGNANGAYYFDGNAYIEVPNSDSLHNVTKAVTISAWVNATEGYSGGGVTLDSDHISVVCKGYEKRQYGLQINNNNEWLFALKESDSKSSEIFTCGSSAGYSIGVWQHVALTWDGATITTYVNGVSVGETQYGTELAPNDESLYIGMDVGGAGIFGETWSQIEYLKGYLDDLRIYNRALSAAEVKALYDGTAVTPTPPANGLWTVTQYNLTKSVVPDDSLEQIAEYAEAGIANMSIRNGDPVTQSYQTLAFMQDLPSYRDAHFRDAMTNYPGSWSNYFVVEAIGTINIPEAGYWTFACGADDVFSATISGSGVSQEFHSSLSGAVSTDLKTVYFANAGKYSVRVLQVNGYSEAALEFSVAKGSYSSFDSSAFKLVGDPASGVTLAGSGEYHTVTFDLNGAYGDAPAERQVAEGAVIGTLPTPEREGYEFLGWHRGKEASSEEVTASTAVTGDMIVYAVWQLAEYTVAFDLNGAEGTVPEQRSVAYGSTLGSLPTPSRDGYTFLGWYTSPYSWEGWQVTEYDTVTGDATYYARWEAITYTVTFDANEGTGGNAYTYYYGDILGTLPTPSRTGYTFLGWFTAKSDGTEVTAETTVSDDVTYYAQWQKVEEVGGLSSHRYEVVLSSGITWTDARSAAIARGGHLATITSAEEWAVLESQCELNNFLWLGGTDKDSEGNWTWVTGEAWSYSRWDATQPDNYNAQHYLLQLRGDWDDEADDAYAYTMAGYIVEYGDGFADTLVSAPPVPPTFSPTDGLVAYWPFDGNANDASGNGNNGAVHGVTLTEDRFGNANGAYYFGSGNYIQVAANSRLNEITNSTMSAWIRADSWYGSWIPIMSKGTGESNTRQYGLEIIKRGYLSGYDYASCFESASGEESYIFTDASIPLGEWIHVAVTRGNGTAHAYLNGVEVGSISVLGAVPFNTEALDIGRDRPGSTEYFYGAMDEMRLYNRALSAAEVKSLYDGTSGTPQGKHGLSISYYDAEDGTTLLNLLDIEGSSYDETAAFFAVRTPNLTANTFDIGDTLDFGYHWNSDGECRFHGKYGDYDTHYFWAFMTGSIALDESGTYKFGIECDDGCNIFIDGQTVVNTYSYASHSYREEEVYLTAGVHNIAISFSEYNGPQGLTIYMKRPSESSASPLPQSILYDDTSVTPVTTYTVTFDLNGAEGDAPVVRQVVEGAAIGDLSTPTRKGYEFLGWYVGQDTSSVEVTASTVVTGNMTVYAVWRVVEYTVTFDLNGADGTAPEQRSVAYGSTLGSLPTPSRDGYTFLGWYTSPNSWEGWQVTEYDTVTGNATYYARWEAIMYTVTFDANEGTGGNAYTYYYGDILGTLPTPSRTGYTFLGWFTAKSGGSQTSTSTTVTADATYYAQWRINSYTVTFDAQGGAGGGTIARNHGAALGELPVPTRDGFSFDGWFTAADGGTKLSSATVITGPVTFYAHWTEQSLYHTPVWYDDDGEEIDWTKYYDGDEEPFAAESAAIFNGYVLDGEEVCGVIQVKVGKANKKTETAKVAAALTLLGDSKKLSYKGTMSKRGIAELTCSGKGNLSLCLGTNAMWGEVDGLSVSGSRNVFAKSGDPKAAVLSRWQGTYTLVLETVDAEGSGSELAWGYSGLTLTVGAKGKVKVKGTMVDGAKVSVSSQLLVGERRCCIPVVVPLYTKKGGFGFNLWLQDDGTLEVGELGEWDAAASKTPFRAWFGENVPAARVGGELPSSLSFLLMDEPDVDGAEVLYDFVPWEVEISAGARWTLPAAGNVKYDRAAEAYVDAKDSQNASGLKLTYVAKTGAFKGTFKLYATDASGHLKKYTAKVSGVMVGRRGYGTATVKNVGSWPVSIQ